MVQRLTFVDGRGEVHRLESGAAPDLVQLLVGSEGTLGIITEVMVRLLPLPSPGTTVAASFPELGSAGAAIGLVMRGLTPSLLEVMDAGTIAAVEEFKPMDLDRNAAAMVFARSDAGPMESRREAELIAKWFEEAGASIAVVSDDEAEGRMLMMARRLAYPALERLGATLLDDVALPLKEIPRFLEAVSGVSQHYELTIGTFGHAGDGNMHPTIVYDATDPEQTANALAAFETLLDLARDLGGTIAGEHGVGILKRRALRAELGNAHALHRAIKRALDPADRLNPGKAL
jgi:glycolate oxidase